MTRWKDNLKPCHDKRKCFGKKHSGTKCGILRETYPDGECPFCKPRVEVTNGKVYPFNPNYSLK